MRSSNFKGRPSGLFPNMAVKLPVRPPLGACTRHTAAAHDAEAQPWAASFTP